MKRKEPPEFDLKAAINRLEELQFAEKLLEQVYQERGPYSDGQITDETWSKVRDFFGFDDSE